ncbi:hypothetical protein GCM10010964_44520 [Caldovatus sediminis]|uniref:Uncharacterized protein n=1 Tax=Caldovatus sediminis TaxID=2041189 RepID=A0A8J2ZFZ2_9PROT|nr:hypothetical protein GCM10010964_44520 [Caldovatus sediminis]
MLKEMHMQTTPTNILPPSGACCATPSARWSGGRTFLAAALATSALGAAGALAAGGWSWLVAAGVAPVLLGALPCLAMCALGLCMGRMGSGCAADRAATPSPSDAPVDARSVPVPSRQGGTA